MSALWTLSANETERRTQVNSLWIHCEHMMSALKMEKYRVSGTVGSIRDFKTALTISILRAIEKLQQLSYWICSIFLHFCEAMRETQINKRPACLENLLRSIALNRTVKKTHLYTLTRVSWDWYSCAHHLMSCFQEFKM